MLSLVRLFFAVCFAFSALARAESAVPSMNGIQLLQFGDFTKEWTLVTTRYRKDSQEMRFIYANPVALHALQNRQMPFPDGSVFAKVGIKTSPDPAFESSMVPSEARRFQLMVKNSKKYESTGGWGFALFDSGGKLFPQSEKLQTAACFACHKIVADRNYVFSELASLSPISSGLQIRGEAAGGPARVPFFSLAASEAKGRAAKFLKQKKIASVLVIGGELRDSFFGGTLDEVTPLLISKLRDGNATHAGFISSDGNTFKMISFDPKKKCGDRERGYEASELRHDQPKDLQTYSFCSR